MICPEIIKQAVREFAPGLPDKGRFDDINLDRLTRMVVQQHQASHDHYDLRLQEGNKAHSWAGKRLPGEKDKVFFKRQPTHTARYMDFEGEIPSGYGAGKVKKILDTPVQIAKSDKDKLKLVIPNIGEVTGIKTKDKDWLFVKKKPIEDPIQYKAKYETVDDKDARAIGRLVNDDNIVAQPKVDGAHNLIELRPGTLNRIYSHRSSKKTGNAIEHTHQVPKVRDADVPKELQGTVLRSEIYGKDKRGKPMMPEVISGLLNSEDVKSFIKQQDIGELEPYIFDIEKYKGEDVSDLPYEKKLEMLKEVSDKVPELKIADTKEGAGDKLSLIDEVKHHRHPDTSEGIVFWNKKEKGGKPKKLKFRDNFDVYIRKIYPADSEKEMAGGFEYSWTPGGRIAGKVGTGFTEKQRKDMLENPEKYKGKVARVKAAKKYKSGALRAPSFYSLDIEKNQ